MYRVFINRNFFLREKLREYIIFFRRYSLYSIDNDLSDEYRDVYELANNFSKENLLPYRSKWDQEEFFPVETIQNAAKLGFGGICIGEKYGGCNMNRLHSSIIFETLSTGCVPTSAYLSIHNMVGLIIDKYGSEYLKQKYLRNLVTCEKLSSYCLTEPDYGSDSSSLSCRATKEDNHYVVNGSKAFISGAGSTDVLIVMLRTGEPGPKGISCLLIESDSPGISFGKKEKKMGWNCQPTCSIFFDNCKVPVTNLIGTENGGFKIAMSALDGGRLNIASCSLGAGYASIKFCVDYLKERKQFGRTLSSNEYIQFRMVELCTKLIASRHMVRKACTNDPDLITKAVVSKEAKRNWSAEVSMAKYFTTENCFHIANECLQFFGGYGYLKSYPIEQYVRDCRVHQILEGSNEVMKMIISRQIFNLVN